MSIATAHPGVGQFRREMEYVRGVLAQLAGAFGNPRPGARRCLICRLPFPASALVNGLCPECRRLKGGAA